MIVVRNRFLPFKGYKAMSIWPFIFTRIEYIFSEVTKNHEKIHGRQQVEVTAVGVLVTVILYVLDCSWWSLLALPLYYELYVIEWLVRKFINENAYRSISFEREAYSNQYNMGYLKTREPFAWLLYFREHK